MLNIFLPDSLYIDVSHKKEVEAIIHSVEDTSIRTDGLRTIEDAIKEIADLGETKIAKHISGGK